MNRENAANIMIVDDDPAVRRMLRRWLEAEGYDVNEAAGGEELRTRLTEGKIDLIILDVGLPGEGGIEIARSIRAQSEVGIIIISGRSKAIDKVVGLEVGADDYVAKPFNPREMVARVRSVLRRFMKLKPNLALPEKVLPARTAVHCEIYRFDGWILDVHRRKLVKPDGTECPLTTAEFQLLQMFVEHPQRVLTRDEIMDFIHGREWSPYDRSIDNQIARLRKKIEPNPTTPEILKTVRGSGYSFTADVAFA